MLRLLEWGQEAVNKKKERANPLRTLWNTLGTIGGVISLSSMVQTWSDDLFKWKGFVASIIESYRSILEPVQDFIFGWLPWNIPYWVGDYLVFGILVLSSATRASSLVQDIRAAYPFADSPLDKRMMRRQLLGDLVMFIFACISIWPIVLAVSVVIYIAERDSDFRNILLWFGAILLGFIVLLAINAMLMDGNVA